MHHNVAAKCLIAVGDAHSGGCILIVGVVDSGCRPRFYPDIESLFHEHCRSLGCQREPAFRRVAAAWQSDAEQPSSGGSGHGLLLRGRCLDIVGHGYSSFD